MARAAKEGRRFCYVTATELTGPEVGDGHWELEKEQNNAVHGVRSPISRSHVLLAHSGVPCSASVPL